VNNIRSIADSLGIIVSTACALHCLLLPVMLVTSATLPAAFLEDESFHQLILWVILPAALAAFGLGCWRHKDLRVLIIASLGIIGICAASILHDLLGESLERVVTLFSTVLLITAHIRNYRLCRSAACNCEQSMGC